MSKTSLSTTVVCSAISSKAVIWYESPFGLFQYSDLIWILFAAVLVLWSPTVCHPLFFPFYFLCIMCSCSSTSTVVIFLAHLSRRLCMSYCDHLPFVVSCHQSICTLSTILYDFSSETPRPVFFKQHVEPSVKGGLKICTNGHSL